MNRLTTAVDSMLFEQTLVKVWVLDLFVSGWNFQRIKVMMETGSVLTQGGEQQRDEQQRLQSHRSLCLSVSVRRLVCFLSLWPQISSCCCCRTSLSTSSNMWRHFLLVESLPVPVQEPSEVFLLQLITWLTEGTANQRHRSILHLPPTAQTKKTTHSHLETKIQLTTTTTLCSSFLLLLLLSDRKITAHSRHSASG